LEKLRPKDHIASLEDDLEKAEQELADMHEAQAKAKRAMLDEADYLAARVQENVERVNAARVLIAELDDFTDAYVIKKQAGQIVDILVESARDLSLLTWRKSTRGVPYDRFAAPGAKITDTETGKTVPF
jgi:hypothetical protein